MGTGAGCDTVVVERTRVDRWLWSVRIYPTRSAATEAIRGGHVRINGSPAKPSSHVRVGDRVTARTHGHDRDLEVVRVIDKRVGAPIAAECLLDHSPPAPLELDQPMATRDRGAGRPTKRDRRALDRLRGR
jgi:ribosome-associated heat shock protein Hsp15